MTSDTFPAYNGIAAADELDELLTAPDFEPAVDVDTEALDVALDAQVGVHVLDRKLAALVAALSAGQTGEAVEGLRVEVRMIVEKLDAITAASIA
jgi:hypothetical protein